jgi:hypothetical protein
MSNRDDDEDTEPDLDYRAFVKEAERMARMLDAAVLVSRKRPDLYDAARIRNGERWARQLRELARRFERWPSLGAEEIALERQRDVPELARVTANAFDLLKMMPTIGTLGKVRFPNK